MEETLDEALDRLFGEEEIPEPPGILPAETLVAGLAVAPPSENTLELQDTAGSLVSQAGVLYRRAMSAQRAGNWSQYGQEIERLGEVLDQMASESN
jgi:uncharacterized membrane protein (UPF0182 family)